MDANCCFCGANVPASPLINPFSDKYASMDVPVGACYGHICPKCIEDCDAGTKTEVEFKDKVFGIER